MQKEIEIAVIPEKKLDLEYIKHRAGLQLNIPEQDIVSIRILKRSIDARGRQVRFRLKVLVGINEELPLPEFYFKTGDVHDAESVIIVGAGPAGLFAALQCIEQGLRPVLLERGKDVRARRRDLALINKTGTVNPDSNYCYGEGGAGTYSDGKLYTRSNKRGDVQKVLQLLVAHGADQDILVDARPHIGTNKLPGIVQALRSTIVQAGGEVHFNCWVADILEAFGSVKGVVTGDGARLYAKHIILATGHSARDIYQLFAGRKWKIEAKPFALGIRVEHPQEMIDRAQYHRVSRGEFLPPAYYSLVQQVDNRGVFSFCMCPGGIIAPCATAENEVVVNGWSPSKRNNPYANSGLVVQIGLEDIQREANIEDPLTLLQYQQRIEQAAFAAGGGELKAPGQRIVDFVQKQVSPELPKNSYKPGVQSTDLHQVLPNNISMILSKALPKFGARIRGFYSNEGIMVGVESRTSAPVRIPRDPRTFQHVQIKGLYPCGEGAGYAGGIVSAAIDGMNCAQAILKNKI